MTQSACPRAEELSGYALGKIDEETAARVERHLCVCKKCELALDELDHNPDQFLVALHSLTQSESPTSSTRTDGDWLVGVQDRAAAEVLRVARQSPAESPFDFDSLDDLLPHEATHPLSFLAPPEAPD